MEELDLKQLFELFWNKKVIILILIIIFAVIGAVYSFGFVTPKYKAATTLVLTKGEGNSTEQKTTTSSDSITATDVTLNSKLVATYSELIKSKAVLREVLSNIGLNDLSEDSIRKSISVSALKDTEVIEITVTNANAVYAAKIANGIAEVFTKKVADIYNINNVHVVDKAEVPEAPANIDHKKDILIFMAIGLVVGIAYVLVANMLDTTVKTTDDIEKNTEAPVLASISMYDFDDEKGGKK